jgi:hypothetical protein
MHCCVHDNNDAERCTSRSLQRLLYLQRNVFGFHSRRTITVLTVLLVRHLHCVCASACHAQVGNAVPYLLAAEVAAAVWQAATGQPGCRPPLLNGPCPEGTGIADPLLLAQHYVPWLQQQQQAAGGWGGVLHACREQLQHEARALQEQQRRNKEAALQQQGQAMLPSAQQVSSEALQGLQTQQQTQELVPAQQQSKPQPQQQKEQHKRQQQQLEQQDKPQQQLQQQHKRQRPPLQRPEKQLKQDKQKLTQQQGQPPRALQAPGSSKKRPQAAT